MASGWDQTLGAAGDAAVRAVLLLAALLVAHQLLRAALAAFARVPGRLGRSAAAVGAQLRPGAARRLAAAALGIGAPALAAVATAPPATASAACAVAPATHRGAPEVVVVQPGDTLWEIARRHLPASAAPSEVARAWPRWYAANRAAIGPDPALLRPGTRLRSPDRRPAGTPASSHDRPSAARTDPGAVARSLDPDRR
jgi:nucleoid-associated protein YgaU